jgi:hypothetical protein
MKLQSGYTVSRPTHVHSVVDTAVRYSCLFIHVRVTSHDRLCGLVARVPATQWRCIVLPVRYELNLYMLCRRK